FFFFFFQAEDGIRDLTVTGVQTCALPICLRDLRLALDAVLQAVRRRARGRGLARRHDRARGAAAGDDEAARRVELVPAALARVRSEERRVGKECRCGGWWGGWMEKVCVGG